MSTPDLAAWRRERRAGLLAARGAMDPATHAAASTRIFAQVEMLVRQSGARQVGAFLPIRNEPDPMPWLHAFSIAGGQAGLPVVEGEALVFHRWAPGQELAPGPLGTRQPARPGVITPALLIVPVLGFDSDRFRLGYGGGYYDRLLAAIPRPRTIGVGFALSRMASIRPHAHDCPMDVIVTEEDILTS